MYSKWLAQATCLSYNRPFIVVYSVILATVIHTVSAITAPATSARASCRVRAPYTKVEKALAEFALDVAHVFDDSTFLLDIYAVSFEGANNVFDHIPCSITCVIYRVQSHVSYTVFNHMYHIPCSITCIIYRVQSHVSYTVFNHMCNIPCSITCIIYRFQSHVTYTVFNHMYHIPCSVTCIIYRVQSHVSYTVFNHMYHIPCSITCIIYRVIPSSTTVTCIIYRVQSHVSYRLTCYTVFNHMYIIYRVQSYVPCSITCFIYRVQSHVYHIPCSIT